MPRAELACARAQLRARHRPPHSPGFWRYSDRVARREIRTALYRISGPPIAHLKLWICIHDGEGAWNDDTGNGYYGGLQMTWGWDGLVVNAALLSPYDQMRAAETGYRRSGYSLVWLKGQWWHPECFRYA